MSCSIRNREDSDQPTHSHYFGLIWIAKHVKFLDMDNEDFHQTVQVRKLS